MKITRTRVQGRRVQRSASRLDLPTPSIPSQTATSATAPHRKHSPNPVASHRFHPRGYHGGSRFRVGMPREGAFRTPFRRDDDNTHEQSYHCLSGRHLVRGYSLLPLLLLLLLLLPRYNTHYIQYFTPLTAICSPPCVRFELITHRYGSVLIRVRPTLSPILESTSRSLQSVQVWRPFFKVAYDQTRGDPIL